MKAQLDALEAERKKDDITSSADTNSQRLTQLEREISEMEDYHMNEIKVCFSLLHI